MLDTLPLSLIVTHHQRSRQDSFGVTNVSVFHDISFSTTNGSQRMFLWRRKTRPLLPFRSGVLIFANVRFVDLSCNNVANHPHLRMDLLRHGLFVDLDAPSSHPPTVYDLIANVTHESVAGTTRDKENTVWKVHLRVGSGGGEGEKWFQIQDLIVEETRKEMIFLGETVLQVCTLTSQLDPC